MWISVVWDERKRGYIWGNLNHASSTTKPEGEPVGTTVRALHPSLTHIARPRPRRPRRLRSPKRIGLVQRQHSTGVLAWIRGERSRPGDGIASDG